MKKLLYNKDRTKIFNLDHLVSIERLDVDCGSGIVLKFSSEDYFLVTPGNSTSLRRYIQIFSDSIVPNDYGSISKCIQCGNYEENKKLYEFFEHMFTRSSLCSKL